LAARSTSKNNTNPLADGRTAPAAIAPAWGSALQPCPGRRSRPGLEAFTVAFSTSFSRWAYSLKTVSRSASRTFWKMTCLANCRRCAPAEWCLCRSGSRCPPLHRRQFLGLCERNLFSGSSMGSSSATPSCKCKRDLAVSLLSSPAYSPGSCRTCAWPGRWPPRRATTIGGVNALFLVQSSIL